jgi:hypothetical protein
VPTCAVRQRTFNAWTIIASAEDAQIDELVHCELQALEHLQATPSDPIIFRGLLYTVQQAKETKRTQGGQWGLTESRGGSSTCVKLDLLEGGVTQIGYPSPYATAGRKRRPEGAPRDRI